MKRSLGQQIFFAIFGTFGRYVTRGTYVEKSQKSTHPIVQCPPFRAAQYRTEQNILQTCFYPYLHPEEL
jgi:hypothetical protein